MSKAFTPKTKTENEVWEELTGPYGYTFIRDSAEWLGRRFEVIKRLMDAGLVKFKDKGGGFVNYELVK